MANRISILSQTTNQLNAQKMVPSTRKNGILNTSSSSSPPSPPHTFTKLTPSQTKTEGSHTRELSTDCRSSNERTRLLCPELAINFTSKLMSNRSGQLTNKQKSLESELLKVQKKLQAKQLDNIHTHALSQLDFHRSSDSEIKSDDDSASLPNLECVEAIENTLSLQVDGSSEDVFLKPAEPLVSIVSNDEDPSLKPSEDLSFESSLQNETTATESESILKASLRLQQRLETAVGCVDDEGELTDCSSDEEQNIGEDAARKLEREELKRNWEYSRAAIGEKWAWLERRIADLNQQICRLDCQRQKLPSKDNFTFAKPDPAPQMPSPCITMPTMNGALISQLQRGGGILSSLHKQDSAAGKTLNGFKSHSGSTSKAHSSSAQFLPQLLLPEGLMNAKIQVKDLLTPSPLGRNFSVVLREEEVNNCARTRALERGAQRKVVKMKKRKRRGRKSESLDPCYHPHLSLPRELPSRVLLDAAVKRITEEHSYAQLPLIKRRKAASSLPHIKSSAPINRFDKSSFSSTPSPNVFYSEKSSAAKVSRKKTFVSQLQSWEAPPTSPSAAATRPDTPISGPPNHTPSLVRKRRPTITTPSFDIDNIVIPYSMAASTRLEKLDYKEIITPSWREVEKELTNHSSSAPPVSMETEPPMEPKKKRTRQSHKPKPLTNHCTNERGGKPVANGNTIHNHLPPPTAEDLSDASFAVRHMKCEVNEKKRFLNFISGGPPRKRSRPQSLASTPDTPGPITTTMTPGSGGNFQPPRRILSSPGPSSSCSLDGGCGGEFFHRVVPPWTPREFPLFGADLDALERPVPPPPRLTPSPLTLATPISSPLVGGRMHSNGSASSLVTPLTSPLSTPSEELPVISPSEWMVVNSVVKSPTATTPSCASPVTLPPPHSYSSFAADNSHYSTPIGNRSIVLKLHKKL